MSHPAPTRADHLAFCRREHWTEVRSSRGRAVTHHATFELALPDGRILRTRISRPPDRSTYGPRLWSHILRDQLEVSEKVFWACVRDRVLPDRGTVKRPGSGLPAGLVFQLVNTVGLPESEVAAMTREQAAQRLARYWSGE